MGLINLNALLERQGSRSPSQAGFATAEGGRASLKLLATKDQLYPALYEILETAEPLRSGIKRQLPAAHPQYQWLFAERVSNIEGLRFNGRQETGEGEAALGIVLEAEPIAYYAEYTHYEISIEFTPRPYSVLSDASLPIKTVVEYYEDGSSTTYGYREEWLRYTEVRKEPSYEYLSAENGQLVFRMNVDTPQGIKNTPVPGGRLRYLVPSNRIQYKWYCVPYSFILSTPSHFDFAIGKVNQHEWNGHAAGTLLLEGVTVDKVYPPAFPQWDGRGGTFVPTQQKLCDITINMLQRNVDIGEGYTIPAGEKWKVAAGHNLILNAADGRYYYAENDITGQPLYPSAAFELLFRNPDYFGVL